MQKALIARLLPLLFFAAPPLAALGDPDGMEALERSFPRESNKITVGEVEDVVLFPWGITLPARIDTGATLSALDARNVTVRNNIAEFRLGDIHKDLWLRFPVVGWAQVSNSIGSQSRPIVEVDICLGSKLIRTNATLSDRSQMTYPFLIGRSVLTGSFMVDTSRFRAARPVCPASAS